MFQCLVEKYMKWRFFQTIDLREYISDCSIRELTDCSIRVYRFLKQTATASGLMITL